MNPSHTYQLHSRLYLSHDDESFITPERMALLKSIATVGSISGGAKAIAKSYKWAWDSIAQMNAHAQTPLVHKSSGGKGGGGATVTPFAKELLHYYEDLEKIHQSKIESYQERFNRGLSRQSFSSDIASTLHGHVESISCEGEHCELYLSYASHRLKAKCHHALDLKAGDSVAFMVESNQIIIATEEVNISAQNLLSGEIIAIDQEEEDIYLSLRLESDEILKVLITIDSLKHFDLKVGVHCFAYFKTYTITILGERSA